MTITLARISVVTASLALAGAVIGALLGAGLLAILGFLADGPGREPYVWIAFDLAAVAGAVLGGIGLPVVAWTLLRHVPYSRIVLETGLGTVIGASIGYLGFALNPVTAVVGGVAGFLLGALQLRIRRKPEARLQPPSDAL